MAQRILEDVVASERRRDDETDSVLSETFFRGKPTHYKVICISMYTKDLERLDDLVTQLKKRGMTKANRSALIRAALEQVDLDRVPRGI